MERAEGLLPVTMTPPPPPSQLSCVFRSCFLFFRLISSRLVIVHVLHPSLTCFCLCPHNYSCLHRLLFGFLFSPLSPFSCSPPLLVHSLPPGYDYYKSCLPTTSFTSSQSVLHNCFAAFSKSNSPLHLPHRSHLPFFSHFKWERKWVQSCSFFSAKHASLFVCGGRGEEEAMDLRSWGSELIFFVQF